MHYLFSAESVIRDSFKTKRRSLEFFSYRNDDLFGKFKEVGRSDCDDADPLSFIVNGEDASEFKKGKLLEILEIFVNISYQTLEKRISEVRRISFVYRFSKFFFREVDEGEVVFAVESRP